MINVERFNEILVKFKKDFPGEHWEEEKYKWIAVKWFQDNWDINAPDFGAMFYKATEKAGNLLASHQRFPRGMIRDFAKVDDEAVRAMFINLFDESIDIKERIAEFKDGAEAFRKKHGEGIWRSHYQEMNAISTYLWLKFPDKYYIYKYSECKEAAKELEADFIPSVGKKKTIDSFAGGKKLYDEICELLQNDDEMKDILKSSLTDDCYEDYSFKTLTVDFCFYISRYLKKAPLNIDTDGHRLSLEEFNPGISPYNKEENPIAKAQGLEPYSKENFLSEVYMTRERYDTLVHLLDNKMNIILQGAPGVGKTFAAKRLAYSIMGEKDDSRIEFVQFHQNYSYEDFIMGYKPVDDGFELKNGIFYRFCQKASSYPDKKFFFIIDEINRGNISKILGELMMLIEKDYRGTSAILAYNGLPFSVPKNLYIIGLMNTADRSLAMIDYALRRRFSFFDVVAGFNSKGFKEYQQAFNNEMLDRLIDRVVELNKEIAADDALGAGFCIGHSYFCGMAECTEERLREVVEYDIIPMLNEYWFDDKAKRQRWENNLRGVFNV